MTVSKCLVLALGLFACAGRPGLPVHDPIAAACTTDRVGTVRVTGADPTAVSSLAVLEGTLYDAERVGRIAEATTEALRWAGYARASVSVARSAGCFTDLAVAVDLGPKFRIARIDFDTDDSFPVAERLALIEDGLGTVNTIGGVHIAYRLKRALAGLEKRYREAGWIDAKIAAPQARYDTSGRVELRIPIAAGPRYKIGAIRALGGSPILRAQILEELGIAEGAWYDARTIRRGIERARRSTDRRVQLRTSVSEENTIELEAVVEAKSR